MQTTPENRKTAWLLLALYVFNLAGMLVWPDQWYFSSGQRFKAISLLQPLYYAIFLTALPIAAISLPTFAKITLLSTLNFLALCLIAGMSLAKANIHKTLKFHALLGIVVLLPAWSILSVPMLHIQAALKANGAPYCVGFPSTANQRVYTSDYNFWSKSTMRFVPLKHPELWSDLQVDCTASEPYASP